MKRRRNPGDDYRVIFNQKELHDTQATTPGKAVSNAAYHYAKDHHMSVNLVQWQINEGMIHVEVKKLRSNPPARMCNKAVDRLFGEGTPESRSNYDYLPSGWKHPIKSQRMAKCNAKLHKTMIFDLPAIRTCPGERDCKTTCYAAAQEGQYPSVLTWRNENWNLAKHNLNDLAFLLDKQLSKAPSGQVIRIHSSGDFFHHLQGGQQYLDMWSQLITKHSNKIFYAYTKSENQLDFSGIIKNRNFNLILSKIDGKHKNYGNINYVREMTKAGHHPCAATLDVAEYIAPPIRKKATNPVKKILNPDFAPAMEILQNSGPLNLSIYKKIASGKLEPTTCNKPGEPTVMCNRECDWCQTQGDVVFLMHTPRLGADTAHKAWRKYASSLGKFGQRAEAIAKWHMGNPCFTMSGKGAGRMKNIPQWTQATAVEEGAMQNPLPKGVNLVKVTARELMGYDRSNIGKAAKLLVADRFGGSIHSVTSRYDGGYNITYRPAKGAKMKKNPMSNYYLGLFTDMPSIGHIVSIAGTPTKAKFPQFRQMVGPFGSLKDLAKWATNKGVRVENPCSRKNPVMSKSRDYYGDFSNWGRYMFTYITNTEDTYNRFIVPAIEAARVAKRPELTFINAMRAALPIMERGAQNELAQIGEGLAKRGHGDEGALLADLVDYYQENWREENPGAAWHMQEMRKAATTSNTSRRGSKKQLIAEGEWNAHSKSFEKSYDLHMNPRGVRSMKSKSKGKAVGAKRKINLNAIRGAIASPRTPKKLKEGLIRKYGKQLGM